MPSAQLVCYAQAKGGGQVSWLRGFEELFSPNSGWPWFRLGSRWLGGFLWEVYYGRKGVRVYQFTRDSYQSSGIWDFPNGGYLMGEREAASAMVSKYIAAVRAKSKGRGAGTCECDPAIAEGRPALTAFLCETDGGEGKVRERSVLMVAIDEGGVRAGLKDADLGGWVWRQGKSLKDALDAIEAALVDPDTAFRVKPAQRARRGRKRG